MDGWEETEILVMRAVKHTPNTQKPATLQAPFADALKQSRHERCRTWAGTGAAEPQQMDRAVVWLHWLEPKL